MSVVTLSTEQVACANFCLDKSRRLAAVTGAAGTGKTTLIEHLSDNLTKQGISHAVAAPTGKAAKRIREATGIRAVTVHKLLEYGRPGERDKDTGVPLDVTSPSRGKNKPFNERVILVDEYSMINHELNRNLIDALCSGGRMIMFGDISQLPPIESYVIKNAQGSPFKEHLARANASFTLTEIFRQKEGSDVLTAATQIRRGHLPKRAQDFRLHFTEKPVDKVRELVFAAQDQDIDYGSIDNQILTPLKSRWIGTQPLNVMLRNILNPNGRGELPLLRHSWDSKNNVTISIGDKVVCTENTYDMRNYTERFSQWLTNGEPALNSFIPTPETKYMLNGETGKVIEIYPDGGLEIDFGDRVVEIPYMYEEWWAKRGTIIDVFPQRVIDLAYALTVHKAQGSEYKHVMYVINSSIFYMLSRENIYTAVTRARLSVDLVTDQRGLMTSLKVTQEQIDKNRARSKGKLVK